jgi:hypothetical protein
MFALSLARLMPAEMLEFYVKYASRQRLRQLAEKITDLQRQKAEEAEDGLDDGVELMETEPVGRRDLWSRATERDDGTTNGRPTALIE